MEIRERVMELIEAGDDAASIVSMLMQEFGLSESDAQAVVMECIKKIEEGQA